nr:beta-ketoacyl synthase N-terminal-like domain-containing protein [Rothia dentocariosa]
MNSKIAIIGMACRFPGGANNLGDFWQLLRDERDAVTEIPADRFGTDFYQHPSKREPGKSYTFAAGVLDNVAGFDAAFFGISPRDFRHLVPHAAAPPQALRPPNSGIREYLCRNFAK